MLYVVFHSLGFKLCSSTMWDVLQHDVGVEQKQNVMLGTRVLWQSRSKKYEALCLPLSLPSGLPSGLFGPLTPLRTAALTLSTPTTTGGVREATSRRAGGPAAP